MSDMNESHRTHARVMTESVAKDIATKCIALIQGVEDP